MPYRIESVDVPQVEYITGEDGIREPNRIIYVGVDAPVYYTDEEIAEIELLEQPKKSHQSSVDRLCSAMFDAFERGVDWLVRATVK